MCKIPELTLPPQLPLRDDDQMEATELRTPPLLELWGTHGPQRQVDSSGHELLCRCGEKTRLRALNVPHGAPCCNLTITPSHAMKPRDFQSKSACSHTANKWGAVSEPDLASLMSLTLPTKPRCLLEAACALGPLARVMR